MVDIGIKETFSFIVSGMSVRCTYNIIFMSLFERAKNFSIHIEKVSVWTDSFGSINGPV
ncbi:unnamed protein product [Ectocarpus sp. 8 AP-2014]